MVICPIARAVGCLKCALFKVCPAKSILGDYNKGSQSTTSSPQPPKSVQAEEEKKPQ
jgi:hypothetical protein